MQEIYQEQDGELYPEIYEGSGETALYETPLGEIFQEAGLLGESESESEYAPEVWEADSREVYAGEMPQEETSDETLAYEFAGIQSEEEIDQFLGKLVRKAARGVRNFARSSAGRAIGGVLRQAARKALPLLGRAAGTFVGGPLGGQIGSSLASYAGQAMGLELQGLSPEDRDLEISRRFVRFAADAVRRAASVPPSTSPIEAARSAMVGAARSYFPGLLRPTPLPRGASYASPGRPAPAGRRGARGTWVRRGRTIVLYGV